MIPELRNRPLLVLALGLVIGLTLREYFWHWLFFVALLFLGDFRGRCFASVGFLVGLALSPSVPDHGVLERSYVDNYATVVSVPRVSSGFQSCEIELSGHRLTMLSRVKLSLGDQVRFSGLVKPLREGTERYYLTHGIVGRAEPIRLELVQEGPPFFRAALSVRDSFVRFSHEALPGPTATLVDALCFNVEGGLDPSTKDQLRNTGTIHIISASGLHVLVLAMAFDWLFGFLPIPRGVRLLLLAGFLVLYACAAGLQPAIVRSVLMALIGLSAYLWQREADLLSSLALTAILYLLFVPLAIYDIGFQFSFLTVAAFGLFPFHRPEAAKRAVDFIIGGFREGLRTTVIAFLATAPLVAFYFGFVSVTAIPTNLIMAPAVMLAVIFAMAAFCLSLLWPSGAAILMSGAVDPLVSFIRLPLELFGGLSFSSQLPAFSGYWLVLIYGLMLMFVRQRVRPA